MVGRPTIPDFLQKVKKLALKKSGVAKSGIWRLFSLKKVKKRENRITAVTHFQNNCSQLFVCNPKWVNPRSNHSLRISSSG
jgi:hypothetical protein